MTALRTLSLALPLALAACAGGDPDDSDTDDTDVEGPSPTCDDEIARRAFIPDADGIAFNSVASDFSFTELDGSTFTLAEWWTGCHNLVFLVYRRGEPVFASDPAVLLEAPASTHYVFLSEESDEADRRERWERLRDTLIEAAPSDDGWEERLHFSVDRPSDIEGGFGDFWQGYFNATLNPDDRVDLGDRGTVRPPPLVQFGLTREQRWDAGGSSSEYVGGPRTFRMGATLGPYYDHLAATRDQGETDGATTIGLLDEEVTDRILTRTVTLPDDLDTYDTLEVDVQVVCEQTNPFACSEWDRIARIALCLDGPECAERREVVRWITPYWRRGERRWIWDATPMLGLLEPGETTFRIEMGPSWERPTPRRITSQLRLRDSGAADRPTSAVFAFGGGTFNADYNDREPRIVDAPASISRAELVYVLSGHGQTSGDNCAEWCNHQHRFTVNDTELDLIQSESGIGGWAGCGGRTRDGVVPGQWGNWAPKRAYWCPGLPVPVERIDITDAIRAGAENTLTYQGLYRNGAPRGGNIALSSYVVFYE